MILRHIHYKNLCANFQLKLQGAGQKKTPATFVHRAIFFLGRLVTWKVIPTLPMAGTMGLNPAKKFPEFDGYAVFMNEQLEGTMDEDSLNPRLGHDGQGGQQKQRLTLNKVSWIWFLGNPQDWNFEPMRWRWMFNLEYLELLASCCIRNCHILTGWKPNGMLSLSAKSELIRSQRGVRYSWVWQRS